MDYIKTGSYQLRINLIINVHIHFIAGRKKINEQRMRFSPFSLQLSIYIHIASFTALRHPIFSVFLNLQSELIAPWSFHD